MLIKIFFNHLFSILLGCTDGRVAPGIHRTRAAATGASGWTDSLSLKVTKTAVATIRARGRPSRPARAVPPAGGNSDRARRTNAGMSAAATIRGRGGPPPHSSRCTAAVDPQLQEVAASPRAPPRCAGSGGSRHAGPRSRASHLGIS
jgi:hypothetical protein